MDRLKFLGCLIFLFGFNNLVFAYDYPCDPPFLSSGRPYSFESSPASLFLSQERAAFALEIAGGEYSWLQLFPWPRIQAYWHLKYKHLGFSLSFVDRYQLTTREAVEFINPDGEYCGKGYLWHSYFIYVLRTGLSYRFFPIFTLGLSGDINYGIYRYDLQPPSGVDDWIPQDIRHRQYSDFSTSFSLGGTITSKTGYKILEALYESELRTYLGMWSERVDYVDPAQISICLNCPIGFADVGLNYYHRFGEYRDYHDSLKTIVSNDFAVNFLFPVKASTKFYLAFYSLPLAYDVSSKGFGFSFGPKLVNRGFLKEFLVIYETGTARVSETLWEWQLTRYGIRLGGSL